MDIIDLLIKQTPQHKNNNKNPTHKTTQSGQIEEEEKKKITSVCVWGGGV